MKKILLAIFMINSISCVQNTEFEPLRINIAPPVHKESNNWVQKAKWSIPKKAFLYDVDYNDSSYDLTYSYTSIIFFRIKNVNTSKTVTFSKVSNGTKIQTGNRTKTYLTGQIIPLLEWLTPDMLQIFHIHLLGAKGVGGKALIQHFSPEQWPILESLVTSLDEFCDVVEESSACMQSFECECGNGSIYVKSCPCGQTGECTEIWSERCQETSSGQEACETYDYCIIDCI